MREAPDAGRVDIRPLDRSSNEELIRINQACPIVSEFTFRFDRGPDFFAWPSRMFESFRYLGAVVDGRLVGYAAMGTRTGWTGEGWGPYVYFGDLRVLPAHRGRWIGWKVTEALIDSLPPQVLVGHFIVKKGNLTAEEVAKRFRSKTLAYTGAGTFEAVSLPLLGFGRRTAAGAGACRRARPDDLTAIAELLDQTSSGRLFAPSFTRGEARGDRPAGVDWERALVAVRGGQLVGVMTWRDFSDVRRTTILSYSLRSLPLRALWRAARWVFPLAAPLPPAGGTLKVLVTTSLAARDDDADVMRALILAALQVEEGRGSHVLQVGGMQGEPVLRAVRGLLRLPFRSDVWIASRPYHLPVVERALGRPPLVDLAIL